ncbi:MAG: hypothetical protein ACRELS_04285 [Candidatus Rokuibacteriota bacterium]
MSRELGSDDVPNALRAAGALVETHEGNFAPDAPDDHWIPEVGRHGWIVLSKDERMRYRLAEKRAIAQAGVRAFFLVPKGLTGPENGRILAGAVTRMTRFAIGNNPPFIAKVFRNGTVKMWERPRP